ncbi:MAG: HD domain-containing protein [Balneola sp.]
MSQLADTEIINKTAAYVREKLEGEGSGHDWWHIQRVWNMAKRLADDTNTQVHLYTVELAALLHDIADHKFHNGDTTIGPKVARDWLHSLNVQEDVIQHVSEIITDVSYKGAGVKTPMKTIEGEIVQDADRLDAIGAIGIARAFAYGGHKSRELYNPEIAPTMHSNFNAYKNDDGHTINHFYEKLFLLKDRMNTNAAKKIAQERHAFMENYVSTFLQEWEGQK